MNWIEVKEKLLPEPSTVWIYDEWEDIVMFGRWYRDAWREDSFIRVQHQRRITHWGLIDRLEAPNGQN